MYCDCSFVGKTALALALEDSNSETAIALINSGADVDLSDDKGVTPLVTAITSGNNDIVSELLNNGASVFVEVISMGEKRQLMSKFCFYAQEYLEMSILCNIHGKMQ